MSWIRLYPLVRDLILDPALGLTKKVEALEPIVGRVRSEFNLVPWAFRSEARPTQIPNVLLRPGDAAVRPDYIGIGITDARVEIELGFETFHSELEVIQNEIVTYMGAATWLFNDLRVYSDRQPDPKSVVVIEIGEMHFQPFLDLGGKSHGFLLTVPIEMRSTTFV